MDDIVRLPSVDRADLFSATAGRRRLRQEIIEKDFWVCWSLMRLFLFPEPPAALLFKGGTSHSKVFHAIERFSEDVDLSFNHANLGFGGDNDLLAAEWQEGEAVAGKARGNLPADYPRPISAPTDGDIMDLLLKVAEHKDVFFPAASAKYAEARPGSLRLVPPEDRLPELEQDYRNMREMIFAEPPSLDHILEVLREIEVLVNTAPNN